MSGPDQGQVCAWLDRLLAEQGHYHPLDLLLGEGRLLYQDYEDWRCGRLDRLEQALFGDPASIQTLLEAMAKEAQARRLSPIALEYQPWGGGPARVFGTQAALNRLFVTGYRRDSSHPQLDLFYDNQGLLLVNQALAAFGARNVAEARQRIQRLMAYDPQHPQLDALMALAQLDPLRQQPLTAPELERMEQQLAPQARALLGGQAQDYLVPLWRLAAESLSQCTPWPAACRAWIVESEHRPQHPISQDQFLPNLQPNSPAIRQKYGEKCAAAVDLQPTTSKSDRLLDRHPAHYWHLAQDWPRLLQSIEASPNWRQDAKLLQLHAVANLSLKRIEAAYADLCLLCWHQPQAAGQAILSLQGQFPSLLQAPWRGFLDLDPELPIEQFPAWMLLERPALAEAEALISLMAEQAAPGWPELVMLLRTERAGMNPEARSRLQTASPRLLRLYLALVR